MSTSRMRLLAAERFSTDMAMLRIVALEPVLRGAEVGALRADQAGGVGRRR